MSYGHLTHLSYTILHTHTHTHTHTHAHLERLCSPLSPRRVALADTFPDLDVFDENSPPQSLLFPYLTLPGAS